MSIFFLYSLAAGVLICLGVHGLVIRRHLLRKVMALNIISGGVFLLLIATAYRNGDPGPDPVPQAMVLTGIVVAVSATAFALALIRSIHLSTEDDDEDDQGRDGDRK
ncbi:MAG TPA: cation:proton antiporter subunit C [Desulfomicrobiaceae bacterium]|nr:cation:proton antiporter subunit C [Desulfomicrobiaceae bacterium]